MLYTLAVFAILLCIIAWFLIQKKKAVVKKNFESRYSMYSSAVPANMNYVYEYDKNSV